MLRETSSHRLFASTPRPRTRGYASVQMANRISGFLSAKISVPVEAPPKRPNSVRDWPAFGMRADRDDIPDGVSNEDALRNRRRK